MNQGKIKKAAKSFDGLINEGGIGAALFFVLVELAYVNAKSLHHLDNPHGTWNWGAAIIGSLAYSVVTVVVMRKPGHKWLKRLFPMFDSFLMFEGLNIGIDWGTRLDDPARLGLSLFFALFTGIITYSLGMINFEERANDERDAAIEDLQRKLRDSSQLCATLEARNAHGLEKAANLTKELERVREQNAKTAKQLEGLRGSNAEHSASMAALTDENAKLTQQIAQVEGEYATYREQVGEYEKEQVHLANELDYFKTATVVLDAQRVNRKRQAARSEQEVHLLRVSKNVDFDPPERYYGRLNGFIAKLGKNTATG